MSYWLKNLFFCCFRRKSPNPFGSSSNESTTVLASASKTTTNTSSVGANTSAKTGAGANTGASAQEAVSKNPFGTPEDSPEKGRLLKGIVNGSDLD